MITTKLGLTFDRWHVVPAAAHRPGKDKPRALVRVRFTEIKERLFGNGHELIARTLRQDCQSWFLLRMGVATSTVVREFKESAIRNAAEVRQEAALMEIEAAVESSTGALIDVENARIKSSLSRLRVSDLKSLLRDRSLPISGTKSVLVDRLVCSYGDGVAGLSPIDRTFARVFSKWILETRALSTRNAMALGHANEPVMLAQLTSFLQEEASADIALSALYEVGLLVQKERQWLDTSPDAVCLLVDGNDSRIGGNEHRETDEISEGLRVAAGAEVGSALAAAAEYFCHAENRMTSVRTINGVRGEDIVRSLEEPCPVELKTKASCNTTTALLEKWMQHGDGKRFFRLHSGDELVRRLGIPTDHVDQVLHHAEVMSVYRCLYVAGTMRSIAYVVLFTFSHSDIHRYISTLERTFWPQVQWMYGNSHVEHHIPASVRDFGFTIERDSLVQRIQLWRAFVQSSKGSDAFAGRPSRVKLRPAVAMQWNYAMGNVDVAHRLMMSASMPTASGLSSQQALVFKFFTVLIVNAYRVCTLYTHKEYLSSKLARVRSGENSAADMRASAKQLLRREPFHKFTKKCRCVLLEMARSRSPTVVLSTVPGARSSEKRHSAPRRKRQRQRSSNDPDETAKRLDKTLQHNEVRVLKTRWCVVCSRSVRVNGKSRMEGHTTSFKCESCDASLCMSTYFPCFRTYHTSEFLEYTPRDSRRYTSPETGLSQERGSG